MASVARGGSFASWVTAICLCGTVIIAPALAAQSGDTMQSRAVVQPLPPPSVADLNTALRRLSRNSQDLDALIEAGNASLQLNDIDAAIGFFGRADELSPGNARVKVGLAGAFVRSERPIEALRLFEDAERAGASTVALAGERGLAYDLVGDPGSAQAQYARALTIRQSDELVRRMALSQAISGDRAGFEKTLLPLLERRDLSAYRTRAFGLAILGDEGEAVAITEAVMPAELSAQMTPYLRYMKRLTKAQQAAAGNLGIFPRAAQIGRDDPRIAQYSGPKTGSGSGVGAVRTADAGLAPQGEPLGPVKRDRASPRRRPDRGTSSVPTPAVNTRVAVSSVAVPAAAAVQTVTRTELPALEKTTSAQISRPDIAAIAAAPAAAAPAPASVSVAVVQQLPAPVTPVQPATIAGLPASPPAAPASALIRDPAPASAPATAPPTEPVSVANAFAGFTLDTITPDKTGAVDISAIKPKREIAVKPEPKPDTKAERKPAAKPEPPKNPSRFWVQVATGRDRKALAFDWRRFSRKIPEVLGEKAKPAVKPHLASWGQATRLLAGPYANEKAAQKAVQSLKAEGIDSFTFTSSAGQEVEELN